MNDILQALQAKVDALMLEYCPDEMTPEQVENWKRHQHPAPEGCGTAVVSDGPAKHGPSAINNDVLDAVYAITTYPAAHDAERVRLARALSEAIETIGTLKRSLSETVTWVKVESSFDPVKPKDGETVLGYTAAREAAGYLGGYESFTFHAADEPGRSDSWVNAWGDDADEPDYWRPIVKGPV